MRAHRKLGRRGHTHRWGAGGGQAVDLLSLSLSPFLPLPLSLPPSLSPSLPPRRRCPAASDALLPFSAPLSQFARGAPPSSRSGVTCEPGSATTAAAALSALYLCRRPSRCRVAHSAFSPSVVPFNGSWEHLAKPTIGRNSYFVRFKMSNFHATRQNKY